MSIDPRDAALLVSCPCMPVPRFGELDGMACGQRTLVDSNGVFTQVRLPWLDCILRIAALPSVPLLPYGTLEERIAFKFGVIPLSLLQEFIEQGRAGLPNEIAGGLIYGAVSNTLRLQVYEAIEAGPAGIRYRMPVLAHDECIAVDLHTHGRLRACWSLADDADDRGVKVCGVFGSLQEANPSAAFRLVVNGHYKALPHPWQRTPRESTSAVDLNEDCSTLVSTGFTEV